MGDTTPYRKLTGEGVRAEKFNGQEIVAVEREAIRALSEQAFIDINHCCDRGISPSSPAFSTTPRRPQR